ncbi:helicase HerA-like domain-containing protein [Plantactinospora sp. CA-290183]|uniref:helicase HerA-like domain-containing protein n=1 Tax=Plantactinospora sp. CA-290183 TaxID=3240006 RepID=UPI003D8E9BA7
MSAELEALEALDTSEWAPTRDEIWNLPGYHVDSLHPEVTRRLSKSIDGLTRGRRPVTAVVLGERGSGKTHLLSWVREQVQAKNGYFFLLKPVAGTSAWESAVGDTCSGLLRRSIGGASQLSRLLTAIADSAGLDPATRAAISGRDDLTRERLEEFLAGLRSLDPEVGIPASDTARALVLLASTGPAVQIGHSYLIRPEAHDAQRAEWGIGGPRAWQLVLRDLTHLIALAGPIVFAFDQLDPLAHESTVALGSRTGVRESSTARRMRDDIATTLMELRDESRRTLIVIACQTDTWDMIARSTLLSSRDRFELLPELGAIPDSETAAAIVSSRFAPGYASRSFTPRYPTWPITKTALGQVPNRYTARQLLIRVNDHVQGCIESRRATEMTALAGSAPPPPPPVPDDTADLNADFEQLRAAADGQPLLERVQNDAMPKLLSAGLRSLVLEMGGSPHRFTVEEDFGTSAELHARLRLTIDEETEQEVHWSFRAIAATHHTSFQTQLKRAITAAGLGQGLPSRRLFVLRNSGFPRGRVTEELKADFERRGGEALVVTASDLRTLAALRIMFERRPQGLHQWLRGQKPASSLEIFRIILADVRENSGDRDNSVGPAPADHVAILVGETQRGRRPFTIPLATLRKHAIVIGSTGSGKTVLVRHLVEQCALRGVSVIVVDPNDDLATLGDPWPTPPKGWGEAQERDARRYFSETEVVVWTPGLHSGRPLTFHPLPDFGPTLDNPDEFRRLIRTTILSLAGPAGATGRTQRTTQQLSVLTRALEYCAKNGGQTLDNLLDVLNEPPDGVADSPDRSRLAKNMAATLDAARDTDPLLDETGTNADPTNLLTPSPGKAARISVVNLIGLPIPQRPSFVNRLEEALFAYFKANPVRDRPLGGLFVLDEAQIFVPVIGQVPSSETTRTLIAQVRKYGLGMLLATQTPKGLHNSVPGNTSSQFIGKLTAPVQQAAADQMAAARGNTLDNISRLKPGVFFGATEGTSFSKIEVPICLSHHREALSEEEVLQRARRQ